MSERKRFVKVFILACSIFFLFFVERASAATYYVCDTASACNANSSGWVTGNNSNTCTTKGAACKTFRGAWAKMAGGDTIIFGDGTYTGTNNSIEYNVMPPFGSAGAYSTFKAEHDGGATFNGAGVSLDYGSGNRNYYWQFEGLVWANTYFLIGYGNHLKILRCGGYNAGSGNVANFNIMRGMSYVLIEDSYAWGEGRYKFLAYGRYSDVGATQTQNIIFRRLVARLDKEDAGNEPIAGIAMYSVKNGLIQNSIVVDSDTQNYWTNIYSRNGCFYVPTTNDPASNITIENSVCLNSQFGGAASDDAASNTVVKNNIFWNVNIDSGEWANYSRSTNPQWVNNTFGVSTQGLNYLSGYNSSGMQITNNLFYRIGGGGIVSHWDSGSTHDYNAFYDSTGLPTLSSHEITSANPIWNASTNPNGALKYITQIEPGSNLSGRGSGGSDIGATVTKMVGASGTLYGDPGYDTVQTTSLWPFPNEALIKSKMAAYTYPGINGARGFAAPGTGLYGGPITLTSYIWEYLGNPCPTGICTSTPDTESPTSPTNLSASSTSQSSISVTWTAATDNVGVTDYLVERCQGSGCSNFTQVGTPTSSPFVDSGLTANTFYNYHVRARDAAGNLSGWSNVVGATTQAPDTQAPTTPSNLQTSVVSSSAINLTWTASADNVGVTGYKVERCSGASCTAFAQIATPTSNSFSDTGLSASTLYRYQVRATDGAGNNSNYSSIAQATTPATPPVSSNLVMAYNFNENTGTTANDLSGNNRNGTLTNGTLWVTGKNNSGISFDGANDYVNIGTQTLPASFTISTWINNSSSQQYETIATFGQNRQFYLNNGTLSFWNGSTQSFGTVSTNVWHHVVVTYDGTNLRGYLNGNPLGSVIATSIPSTSGPTYLGAWYTGSGQGEFLSGSLDDIRIYNTALTQAQIQTDMNTPLTQGGSGTFTPCNTVTTANFSQAVYNAYGAPFDAFQTGTNLINASCNSADPNTIQTTLGVPGDTTRIVYTKGYYYAGSNWTQYTGTCTGALNGDWCQGSVSAMITNPNISTASASTPTYFVGMTCSVQGGGWKCGCRDTTCANFYWQVQGAGL